MTDYYVSKTGSNGNALSLAAAKTTIAAGAALMVAGHGDRLLIDDGMYPESLRGVIPAGTSGNPTVIMAINRPTSVSAGSGFVILRPTGGVNVVRLNHDYITLDGLDCDAVNCTGSPIDGYNGGAGVSRAVISYCVARNGHGIVSSSSGISGDFHYGTIEYCEAYANDTGTNQDHGIYTSATSCTIRYNYSHDNGAYGIHLYPTATSCAVYANRIASNILRGAIFAGSANQIYLNIFDSNGQGVEIRGNNNWFLANLVYNCGTGTHAIWFSTAGSTGNVGRDNLCYLNVDNTVVDAGASNTVNSNRTTNPSWTDPANHDFTLQVGSPCRGAGIDLSAYGIVYDFAGQIRPAVGADQGPYQYSSVSAAASTGTGSVSGVGRATAAAATASVGHATALAGGRSVADSPGTSAGESTVLGVGVTLNPNTGIGGASGTSTAQATGAANFRGTATAEGTSTAVALSPVLAEGIGLAEGTSSAHAEAVIRHPGSPGPRERTFTTYNRTNEEELLILSLL